MLINIRYKKNCILYFYILILSLLKFGLILISKQAFKNKILTKIHLKTTLVSLIMLLVSTYLL